MKWKWISRIGRPPGPEPLWLQPDAPQHAGDALDADTAKWLRFAAGITEDGTRARH